MPPPHHNAAFISTDHDDDDDYYRADPGIHPPTASELDIEFGNDNFDATATQYCGMNAASVIVSNTFAYQSQTRSIALTMPSMAKLQLLPTLPLPLIINHWVEACSGGMLARLSVALLAGITIKRVTLVEKNRTVRFIAANRLSLLQQ